MISLVFLVNSQRLTLDNYYNKNGCMKVFCPHMSLNNIIPMNSLCLTYLNICDASDTEYMMISW